MKRSFCQEPERPKTANLERPSVLNPKLVDKLDMSLLSKELLCDSMTRYRQARSLATAVGGGTTTKTAATSSYSSSSSSLLLLPSPSSTRRRQSAVVTSDVQPRRTATTTTTATTWPRDNVPVRQQRRSFEQIYEPRACQMEIGLRSPTESQKTLQEPVKRNSDVKRLDDNNNRSVLQRSRRNCECMTGVRLTLIISLATCDENVADKFIFSN